VGCKNHQLTTERRFNMAEYQYVTIGMDDGAMIGAATTSKIGFYGATPRVQVTGAAVAVTAGATTTVCNTAVGELQAAMSALGLMAAAQS
jgi:hypothetical protein